MGSESEAEVELYVKQVVVVLLLVSSLNAAIIDVRVLCVNLQILGEVVVQTALYLVH